MGYFHKTMALSFISLALVLASPLPSPSLPPQVRGSGKESLRDLCNNNFRPKQCWEIIKNNNVQGSVDNICDVLYSVLHWTSVKGIEILDQLNKLYNDTNNGQLKIQYRECVRDYKAAVDDLDEAVICFIVKGDTEPLCRVSAIIHKAMDDFEDCRHSFDKGSFDPAHILDRNHEFLVYTQLAMATAERAIAKQICWIS